MPRITRLHAALPGRRVRQEAGAEWHLKQAKGYPLSSNTRATGKSGFAWMTPVIDDD
jgi:hypothetical protein